MKLQEFLELNVSKKLGDTFIYERMIVCTAITHPLESHRITVSIYISGLDWVFCDILNERELDSHDGEIVAFFKWLEDCFFPKMRESLNMYILKNATKGKG